MHDGDEIVDYQNLGIKNIICFEPMPTAILMFRSRYPQQDIQEYALSDKDEIRFFLITNDGRQGQTSSFYDVFPEYTNMTGGIKEKILVTAKRFDSWARDNNVNLELYDTIVIDTQGSELEVIRGFGSLIKKFAFWIVECSEKAIYVGGADALDVIAYMNKNAIKNCSPILAHDDIYFIKEQLLH